MFYDPKHKFGAPEHFYFAEKRDIRGFSFARQNGSPEANFGFRGGNTSPTMSDIAMKVVSNES